MYIKTLVNGWKNSIKDSVKRFPIPIFLSIAAVITLIYMGESIGSDEELRRVVMTLVLSIPVYICIELYFERRNKSNEKFKYLIYIIAAICLAVYGYFCLGDLNMVQVTRYVGLIIIFITGFFFTPYIYKDGSFEMYVIKVLGRFFTTVLYSIVLYLGLIAILFTVDYLLGIEVKYEIYYYTWLIVVGVFAQCFFLGGIPEKEEVIKVEKYPKVFKILMLYIIMPLISIYTIILYIYFAKIIITRQWPEGLVSHLVLWYGVISAGTLFLTSPVKENSPWVSKFVKVFPKAILPLIVLMFISMGIRVNAYGITENRYFVLALGIWVFGIMVYYSIIKKVKNIILPISLAIITFISICGPLSSYSLSKYSQNKRFEKFLIKNNMIENGKIVKAIDPVSKDDQIELNSILDYFNRKHELKDIKYLPGNFTISDTERVLGITYSNLNYESRYEHFYFTSEEILEPIEIKDYDYLFNIISYQSAANKNSYGITVDYNKAYNELKILEKGKQIYNKNLNEYFNRIIDKYGVNKTNSIPVEDMQFEDETDKVKIKIKIDNFSGRKDLNYDHIESTEIQFSVFVKIK